jgi:hypothetical protein
MRLFDENESSLPLTLISATPFTSGVLHLVYGPVETSPDGTYREASKAMAEAAKHP